MILEVSEPAAPTIHKVTFDLEKIGTIQHLMSGPSVPIMMMKLVRKNQYYHSYSFKYF